MYIFGKFIVGLKYTTADEVDKKKMSSQSERLYSLVSSLLFLVLRTSFDMHVQIHYYMTCELSLERRRFLMSVKNLSFTFDVYWSMKLVGRALSL